MWPSFSLSRNKDESPKRAAQIPLPRRLWAWAKSESIATLSQNPVLKYLISLTRIAKIWKWGSSVKRENVPFKRLFTSWLKKHSQQLFSSLWWNVLLLTFGWILMPHLTLLNNYFFHDFKPISLFTPNLLPIVPFDSSLGLMSTSFMDKVSLRNLPISFAHLP